MFRKLMTMAMIGGLVVATAACNTVRGVGEDLGSVANEVDDEI